MEIRRVTEEQEGRLTVTAIEGDGLKGTANGVVEQRPKTAEITTLWTEGPEEPGLQVALVEAVAQWARERGARRLGLWVQAGDPRQLQQYRRIGFMDTGESRISGLPPVAITEIRLERPFEI